MKFSTSGGASLFNIAVRGLTIVSKFILIMYMARVLPTKDLGIYGLFVSTVTYSLYLVGMDYYNYVVRELLMLPESEWAWLIRDQFVFYLITYSIIFPLLLLIFWGDLLPWNLIGWFFAILVFEHLSQEIYRILIALHRPVLANLLSFFRLGAWVYAVMAVYLFTSFPKSLEVIWAGWLLGGGTCILIGGIALKRAVDWTAIRSKPINWLAMWKGYRTATQYLVATISLQAIYTADRYILKAFTSVAEVGVYSFFMSISMSIQSFLDAGVMIFSAPGVIKSYQSGDMVEYRKQKKKMRNSVLMWLLILSLGVIVIISPLLRYIGKEEFLLNLNSFYWLVAATCLMALSNLPHYSLYARRKDRGLVRISVASTVIFVLAAFLFTPIWGMAGLAASLTFAMGLLFVMKYAYLRHIDT
ncbi:lipopolysaccharide biosynthesis protein [Persicitalea sp.]|uniref:lipopolysaccharide biosynthesis protein n=1 Tax=Persicitalea sp. TaxID=3100273 RepID=UPI00359398C2